MSAAKSVNSAYHLNATISVSYRLQLFRFAVLCSNMRAQLTNARELLFHVDRSLTYNY